MRTRTVGFLGLAATTLIIALSTGTPIYYLIATMLMAMALIGFVSALVTARTIEVGLSAQRRRAVRGDTAVMRVTVRRRFILPPGLVEIELDEPYNPFGSPDVIRCAAPLKGREYRLNIECAHRGVSSMGVTRVSVTDIFGLFTFSKRPKDCMIRLEVAPKLFETQALAIPPGDTGPMSRVMTTEDLASPAFVREWEQGDTLKKVHWKLTARRRELMVRTYEESARPDFLILMDCAPVNAFSSRVPSFEDALCEQAASVALAQMQAGYPVRMPLASSQPREASGQTPAEIGAFLNALTWLRFDGRHPFDQIIALEMRRLQRTGALILITTHLNAALAELVLRIRANGVSVEYILVSDSAGSDHETLKKRLEGSGVSVKRVKPE